MGRAKKDWRETMRAAMVAAAKEAGVDASGVQFEGCNTDSTWGDWSGLVFFGADAAVLERCARFFEAWAHKHLRSLGVEGGYSSQESIAYEGRFTFTRYTNGAKGWHRGVPAPYVAHVLEGCNGFVLDRVEEREGYATSYVYYPCAD